MISFPCIATKFVNFQNSRTKINGNEKLARHLDNWHILLGHIVSYMQYDDFSYSQLLFFSSFCLELCFKKSVTLNANSLSRTEMFCSSVPLDSSLFF